MSRFIVEILVEGTVDITVRASNAERAEQMAETRIRKQLERAGIEYPSLWFMSTEEA